MSNTSIYIGDSELQKYLEGLPNKSEVIRQLLRQHRDGQSARVDQQIAQKQDRIDEIDDRISALRDERTTLEEDIDQLNALSSSVENAVGDLIDSTIEVFTGLVTVEPDMRTRSAKVRAKNAGIPDRVWETVLDEVEIHYFDEVTNEAIGGEWEDDLQSEGWDVDDVTADGLSTTVTDGDVSDYLSGLTEREREEVVRVAEEVK